jgi:hypothetical protein
MIRYGRSVHEWEDMYDGSVVGATPNVLYICIYTYRNRRRRLRTGEDLDRLDISLFRKLVASADGMECLHYRGDLDCDGFND